MKTSDPKFATFVALVSLLFGLVCAMLSLYLIGVQIDIDNAEAEANLYCKNVHAGVWPDYEQQYEKFCDGPKWNGK